MARYMFDAEFEMFFIATCTNANSIAEAAFQLRMNYKTVRSHAIRLGCFKTNQPGKNRKKRFTGDIISLESIFNGSYPTYQSHKLRRRLLQEGYKNHQC